MENTALYRTVWRWHFYAGLLVIPLVLVLSLTGAAYLFKPQIDRWEERAFRGLGEEGAVSPAAQLAAAMEAFPRSRFDAYRLPEQPGDAAAITLASAGGAQREVFVSPQGQVLGTLDPANRITPLLGKFHGSLMLGRVGDWIVELAASWAIVMILTGLYLWWPKSGGWRLARILWPRLGLGGRAFWRDLHAVTGFWVAGLALVMLATGLPWAGVWGSALASVRAEFGLVKGVQDWKTGSGGNHSPNDHGIQNHTIERIPAGGFVPDPMFNLIVAQAKGEHLAFPASVLPPGAPQRFGPPTGPVWTAKSEAQNRPLQRSVTYDPVGGRELSRSGFEDRHAIDRAINYGIAFHEGQLFGVANQLLGVGIALMLVAVSVSGFVMWRKRRPAGTGLGAPPAPPRRVSRKGIIAGIITLAAFLPLFALSLAGFWLAERLVLRRIPPVARWLGLA